MTDTSRLQADKRPGAANEKQLVSGLRAGDAASYEHLVRSYAGRMLSVARRYLRNEADARDCVQDAFLQAFRGIERFEERSSLASWLHRIVVNEALSKIRVRERRREDSLDALLPKFDSYGGRVESEPEAEVSLESPLERQETRELVRRAIDRLPEGYRSVLLARDVDGYDTEETASLLGMTPGTVKTRLHRARAALKTLMEPLLRGEGM